MANGIINIYKEKGFTSFDVVAKLRGMLHQKKIGHTGTLDPEAEGVLPVCLGSATKVCELLTDKDKVYEAVLLLGTDTDTQDTSGQVLRESEVTSSEEEVRNCILSFVGVQEQIPPMYSALKVNGQKLYDLARQGITVERKARTIEIFDIQIQQIRLPEVRFQVHCSRGTYIRTLCHDIGEKLGCGGCMKQLLRTRVSCFELKDSLKLSELQQLLDENPDVDPEQLMVNNRKLLRSVDSLFDYMPSARVLEQGQKLLSNGNRVPDEYVCYESEAPYGCSLRVYDADHNFYGIYLHRQDPAEIKPIRFFMTRNT